MACVPLTDTAANNTSLVLEITWRGRRLLFAGDAEQESWALMAARARLKPVDLYKVAHHGSVTGHPPPPVLDLILPAARRQEAVAVLSTRQTPAYGEVPHPTVIGDLVQRTRWLYRTDASGEEERVAPGAPVVVSLPARE